MKLVLSTIKCPICYNNFNLLKIAICNQCRLSICRNCVNNLCVYNYTNCPNCRIALDINKIYYINKYIYCISIVFKYTMYTSMLFYVYNILENLL